MWAADNAPTVKHGAQLTKRSVGGLRLTPRSRSSQNQTNQQERLRGSQSE